MTQKSSDPILSSPRLCTCSDCHLLLFCRHVMLSEHQLLGGQQPHMRYSLLFFKFFFPFFSVSLNPSLFLPLSLSMRTALCSAPSRSRSLSLSLSLFLSLSLSLSLSALCSLLSVLCSLSLSHSFGLPAIKQRPSVSISSPTY